MQLFCVSCESEKAKCFYGLRLEGQASKPLRDELTYSRECTILLIKSGCIFIRIACVSAQTDDLHWSSQSHSAGPCSLTQNRAVTLEGTKRCGITRLILSPSLLQKTKGNIKSNELLWSDPLKTRFWVLWVTLILRRLPIWCYSGRTADGSELLEHGVLSNVAIRYSIRSH